MIIHDITIRNDLKELAFKDYTTEQVAEIYADGADWYNINDIIETYQEIKSSL